MHTINPKKKIKITKQRVIDNNLTKEIKWKHKKYSIQKNREENKRDKQKEEEEKENRKS